MIRRILIDLAGAVSLFALLFIVLSLDGLFF